MELVVLLFSGKIMQKFVYVRMNNLFKIFSIILLSHNDDGVGAVNVFDIGICSDIREPSNHLSRMHSRLIGKPPWDALGVC